MVGFWCPCLRLVVLAGLLFQARECIREKQ
jgi:hypothetical protein